MKHEARACQATSGVQPQGLGLPCAHGPSRAASSMLCERSERADNRFKVGYGLGLAIRSPGPVTYRPSTLPDVTAHFHIQFQKNIESQTTSGKFSFGELN